MVFFIFVQILLEHSLVNSGDLGQMQHSAASNPGLRCFPMSHKIDASLIRYKM